MTIIFTAATSSIIVMTVDSAVTLEFENHREYEQGSKFYLFPGTGVVATWGARDGNRPGLWLREQVQKVTPNVDGLADLVYTYITSEYQPRERGADDVGYHIAGFQNAQPRVHHVFWGVDRPRLPEQVDRYYNRYDHSPHARGLSLLYNGRNDLAAAVVGALLAQIQAGGDVRYDIHTIAGLVKFSDFVARYASELTPEVGPPFTTILLTPQGGVERITNNTFAPLNQEEVAHCLRDLGVEGKIKLVFPIRNSAVEDKQTGPLTAPSGIRLPNAGGTANIYGEET